MNKVNVKLLSLNEVVEMLEGEIGNDVGEWLEEVWKEEGSGVYEVVVGSRGEVEEIVKNDEYEVVDDDEWFFVEENEKMVSVSYSEECGSYFVGLK